MTTFSADSVISATPTGSTAYSFSAGGPIVSPSVPCIVVTPIAAPVVFDRSLVLASDQRVRLEVIGEEPGLLSVDGRASLELPVGSTVRIGRARRPRGSSAARTRRPSTTSSATSSTSRDRRRSGLGSGRAPQLHISGLGVIDDLDLELHPGLNVLTGETGTGKTMVTVGLQLALGRRGGSSLVREGASAAKVQARFDAPPSAVSAGWAEDDEVLLARTVTAEGEAPHGWAVSWRRCPRSPSSRESSSRCTASTTDSGCCPRSRRPVPGSIRRR